MRSRHRDRHRHGLRWHTDTYAFIAHHANVSRFTAYDRIALNSAAGAADTYPIANPAAFTHIDTHADMRR